MVNFTKKIAFSELIQQIESRTGFTAKQAGTGVVLRCPSHNDKNPSLSISESNDGKILLNCFAGCSFEEICTALDLEATSFFSNEYNSSAPTSIKRYPSGTKAYPYHDEQRNLLYWKCRFPNKHFLYQRYDENNNIISNINGCRKVLYQLPRIMRGISLQQTIFLVEGEKDANTLLKSNLIATTAPTPQWLDEYTETLKDADVVILYDYDKAGFKRRDLLCNKLHGNVKRLRIVNLPGLEYSDSNGKDITDWLEMGNTIEQLLEIVNSTDDYIPPRTGGGIVVMNFKDFLTLKISKPEILLSPFLWSQGLALLYAKRGVGKTHIALGIACAVAKGSSFLKWSASKPKKVLYIDGEMSAYSMQARLRSMPATEDELHLLSNNLLIITPDLQEAAMPNLSTSEGRSTLEKIIIDRDLIVVDNLSSLFRSGTENEAESWMPIQEWALSLRRQGKTILFIHHAGKNGLQRGTSKREDTLDVVINLRECEGYNATQGARFEVHFEKTRHFAGEDAAPFQAQLFIDSQGQAQWKIACIKEDPEIAQIAQMRKDGKTFVEIMSAKKLTKSQVETRLQKAKQAGLLH